MTRLSVKGIQMIKMIENNKGAVTIEACVVIPISITVIMLLLWTGFFGYNRMALAGAAEMAAIKGAQNAEKSNEEICQIVEQRVYELLKDELVFMRDVKADVNVSYDKVTVKLSGDFLIPKAILVTNIYRSKLWRIETEKTSSRIRCSQVIRTVSGLKNAKNGVSDNQAGREEKVKLTKDRE